MPCAKLLSILTPTQTPRSFSIFAKGVDLETEPDAAIPPKTGGPRGARCLRARGGKNGRTYWSRQTTPLAKMR